MIRQYKECKSYTKLIDETGEFTLNVSMMKTGWVIIRKWKIACISTVLIAAKVMRKA